MKIRHANKFDFPQIGEMLRRFKLKCPTDISINFDNETHVEQLNDIVVVVWIHHYGFL